MLHERLIANEEQSVKLQDEVIHLKQQLHDVSAYHTAAELAISLFAETMFCGIQGFSSVYGNKIITPEVLRHLKCLNIGILHDTTNCLYVMSTNMERIKLCLEYPHLLQTALQSLWPDNKYESSQTVLIQENCFHITAIRSGSYLDSFLEVCLHIQKLQLLSPDGSLEVGCNQYLQLIQPEAKHSHRVCGPAEMS